MNSDMHAPVSTFECNEAVRTHKWNETHAYNAAIILSPHIKSNNIEEESDKRIHQKFKSQHACVRLNTCCLLEHFSHIL